MNKTKTLTTALLLLIFMCLLAFRIKTARTTPTTINVPGDYSTIQQAVNAANPGDIIQVNNGTYYENLVVNKTLALIGEGLYDTTIDGGESSTVVLVTSAKVNISEFTIRNSKNEWPCAGIRICNSSDSRIANVNAANNWVAVWLEDSSNNTLANLTATNNRYGLWLVRSHNNTIVHTVTANNTRYGVWLEDSSNNALLELSSSNNEFGMQLERTNNNKIYHNRLLNNTYQVANIDSISTWDDGYPSGGNYWTGYAGVDVKSGPNQDQPGSDGIGDTPYIIDDNNRDRYPLMNPLQTHDIAITNIAPAKTIVGQGYNLAIDVHVQNQGNRLESVNVTVYINTTSITQTVNLTLGENTIRFTQNTTPLVRGSYFVNATAWSVPGEINTTDNTFEYSGAIKIAVAGDIDADRDVDIYDVVAIASIYGIKRGESRFIPNCDIDGNNVINIYDVVIATSRYGYKES